MLRPTPFGEVPSETARVARAAFRKGNFYLRLRDEAGALFQDSDFEALFPTIGRPGVAPWRLALVTIFQFLEALSDRQAADSVRGRLDWKYALGLELTDSGFDYSILSDFRGRLIEHEQEGLLLDLLLKKFVEQGWVKARGKQRTDSTHIIGAVRRLTRLELLGETMRAALNELARVDPAWLSPQITNDTIKRYGHRIEEGRLPRGEAKRDQYAVQIGQEGFALLERLERSDAIHLIDLPAIQTLKPRVSNSSRDVVSGGMAFPQIVIFSGLNAPLNDLSRSRLSLFPSAPDRLR